MTLIIRAARRDDIPAITRMAHQLSLSDGDPTGHFTEAAARRAIFGARPDLQALIAERDGEICGYVLAHEAYDTPNAQRGLYVSDIYVEPQMRGTDAARALMAATIRFAKARGLSFLWWVAKPHNERGLGFYRKIGAMREDLAVHAIYGEAWDALARECPEGSFSEIPGLAEIAGFYRGLICDLWGVVHNGRQAFPATLEALSQARDRGLKVIFLSNAPRPENSVRGQLDALGVARDLYLGIVTSGAMTRAAIATGRFGTKLWHLGPERDLQLFDGLSLERVDLQHAEFILCTGLFDDTTEQASDYAERFRESIARDLMLICANPDLAVIRGDQKIPCAGALAALYEDMGGRVARYGKPDPEIFDAAIARLDCRRDEALVIGDGLRTDINGANAAGLDALLIAGGVDAKLTGADQGALDLDRVFAAAAAEGGAPRYAMRALKW